jgi:hypothetical protein
MWFKWYSACLPNTSLEFKPQYRKKGKEKRKAFIKTEKSHELLPRKRQCLDMI